MHAQLELLRTELGASGIRSETPRVEKMSG
jgi:hypothetical protein